MKQYTSRQRFGHRLAATGLMGVTLLVATLASVPATAIADTTLSQQRTLFATARDALKSGRHEQFQRLSKQLEGYPLHPYLEYWQLSDNLSRADGEAVARFIRANADTPLAGRLRNSWLDRLSTEERWPQYLAFYTPSSDIEQQCFQRRALYKTGDKRAAFDGLEKIWLTGSSLPRACDPLFTAWRDAGVLDQALVWQRVERIMLQGETYEAKSLEPFLSKEQRARVELWQQVHLNPEKMLSNPRLKENSAINQTIVAYGVRRLARINPVMAAENWNRLIMEYGFTPEEFDRTETTIALALARNRSPDAMRWLTSMRVSETPAVREWRALTAINQGKWDDALRWIEQLSAEEQRDERWLYWRARAYEATGKPERARLFYTEAAKNRDYYGFMAADRSGLPYELENRPLKFSEEEMRGARNLATLRRVYEFFAMGDITNARREWYYLTQTADRDTLLKAARLAHEWGWHDRAILALGRANYLDDIEIRFPTEHREDVISNARIQKIDPSWAFAIIRQESIFDSGARSPKGALGLMQIMPNTGKMIARDLSTRLHNSDQLLDSGTNIRFGISYMRKVLNRFDQNTALATAAYNAGSQRVKGWLRDGEGMETDLWVENIPFKETRHYVKQVLAFATIYDNRLARPATPIRQRMPQIQSNQGPSS